MCVFHLASVTLSPVAVSLILGRILGTRCDIEGVGTRYYMIGWGQNPQKVVCSCDSDRVGAFIFLHIPVLPPIKPWFNLCTLLFLSIKRILGKHIHIHMPVFLPIWIFMLLGGDICAQNFHWASFTSSSKTDVNDSWPELQSSKPDDSIKAHAEGECSLRYISFFANCDIEFNWAH